MRQGISTEAKSRPWRERIAVIAPAVVLTIAGLVVAYQFVKPAPPRHIVMATGPEHGVYAYYGRFYRDRLAEEGVDVTPIGTGPAGSAAMPKDGSSAHGERARRRIRPPIPSRGEPSSKSPSATSGSRAKPKATDMGMRSNAHRRDELTRAGWLGVVSRLSALAPMLLSLLRQNAPSGLRVP
jgi:hypothetical protein